MFKWTAIGSSYRSGECWTSSLIFVIIIIIIYIGKIQDSWLVGHVGYCKYLQTHKFIYVQCIKQYNKIGRHKIRDTNTTQCALNVIHYFINMSHCHQSTQLGPEATGAVPWTSQVQSRTHSVEVECAVRRHWDLWPWHGMPLMVDIITHWAVQ